VQTHVISRAIPRAEPTKDHVRSAALSRTRSSSIRLRVFDRKQALFAIKKAEEEELLLLLTAMTRARSACASCNGYNVTTELFRKGQRKEGG
jgi:hypothetical protein